MLVLGEVRNMFRFKREMILPLFLSRGMTIQQLAKMAGVAYKSANKAVNGIPVSAPVADKIARALNFDAIDFLAEPAQAYSE